MRSTFQTLWRRAIRDPDRTLALTRHVAAQFNRDQCFVSAGMLTYATLLSLVPLMTVVVSIVTALPGAESWNLQIQQFLFNNFVPAARETILTKINELIANARGITAAMSLFLIVTSIILMHNIELTINRIFGVQSARSLLNRFMVYWAALTLGPILLGASLALSSYFFSLRIFTQVGSVSMFASLFQALMPFAVGGLAFFLIFAIVPNRKVPWRHAAVGALLTALLFELTKSAFGFYVSSFDSYTRLYGALAAIPIFLVWIYLSWSIVLLGASFTAALGTFRYHDPRGQWPEGEEFILLYRLLGHLWQAQQVGQSLDERDLLKQEPEAADAQIQVLLEYMRRADIVRRDEAADWVLVRDLSQLSVADLYRTGTYRWPDLDAWSLAVRDDDWNDRLVEALKRAESDGLSTIHSRAMKSFYAGRLDDTRGQMPLIEVEDNGRRRG